MATSGVNITDQSGLDASFLSPAYQQQFRARSVARVALNGQGVVENGFGVGRTVTFNKFSGVDPTTTATDDTDDFSFTTPTGGTASASVALYTSSIKTGGLTRAVTPGDLAMSFREALGGWCGEQFDLLALTALVGGTKIRVNSRADDASIVAGDVISTSEILGVVETLESNKAPRIDGPAGPGYIGFLAPKVKFDLFRESGGDFKAGLLNVKDRLWDAYMVGFAMGVYWFDSPSEALVTADAGDGGTVDVYHTPILGARALGMAYAPVESIPGVTDIDASGLGEVGGSGTQAPGSMVVRMARPMTNAGYYLHVHALAQLGFGLIMDDSIRVLNSSASRGANT